MIILFVLLAIEMNTSLGKYGEISLSFGGNVEIVKFTHSIDWNNILYSTQLYFTEHY